MHTKKYPFLLIASLLAIVLALGVIAPVSAVDQIQNEITATYNNFIEQIPVQPSAGESVRVWIDSDTANGETILVETKIGTAPNEVYTKYTGNYDIANEHLTANWYVDLPGQPAGTYVEYQRITRNQSGVEYFWSGFVHNYTVATNTGWYGDGSATSFTLMTANDLAGLDELLNSGVTFVGKTINLGADIDLAGRNFAPLGSYGNSFQGTFDGNGFTISNLSLTQGGNYAGLFARIFNGVIKNLTVNNFNVTAPEYAGAVSGEIYTSDIINVHVTNSTVTTDHFGGGITGYLYGNISDSSANTVTVKALNQLANEWGNKMGGLVGYVGDGNYTLQNNSGTNVTVIGIRDVGGLFGTTQAGNRVYNNTVTGGSVSAVNTMGTEPDAWAGGIVGRMAGKTTFGGNVNNGMTVTSYDPADAGPVYGGPASLYAEGVYNETQGVWYATIGDAVAASVTEDVITVGVGTYEIGTLTIDKPITLQGAGDTTVVNGDIILASTTLVSGTTTLKDFRFVEGNQAIRLGGDLVAQHLDAVVIDNLTIGSSADVGTRAIGTFGDSENIKVNSLTI